jgi:hypothetical protein
MTVVPGVQVVECATCASKVLCKRLTDATGWAAQHARDTNHWRNYRVRPLDPHTIRGRVWWHPERRLWLWEVNQPGLTVSWGDAVTFGFAQIECALMVGTYRRFPICWTADDPDREDAR